MIRRNGKRVWAVGGCVLAAVALVIAGAGGYEPPAGGAPAGVVDEETARVYNELRERASEGVDRMVEQVARRYELTEAQQESVRTLARRHAEAFVERNGSAIVDMIQRGRAVGELMGGSRVGWQEVPADIRQDMVGRALPLIDAVEKGMTDFADEFEKGLDAQQKQKLAEDRRRMSFGLAMARFQAKYMVGMADEQQRPQPPEGQDGPGADSWRPQRVAGEFDQWRRYVEQFVARYHLDEVQKLQARDLLGKYEALAGKAPAAAATRPTSSPTSRPAAPSISMTDFRRRLEDVRARKARTAELFEQLKKELDEIPTPVQRKLGGDDGGGGAASRPAGR